MADLTGVEQETQRHLTHVARGGAVGLVGAGVSAVATFGLALVVTNRFSAETAGLFFASTSVFLLLSAVATLGTDTGLSRFLLRFEAQGRPGDIPAIVRTAVVPPVVLSVVLAVATLLVAEPLAAVIGLDGPGGADVMRVLAVLFPFATVGTVALAGTRAFGRMRTTVMVDKIARPVAQPLLVLLLSLGGSGVLLLTWAWSIPYAVAGVVSALLFYRFVRRRGSLVGAAPTRSRREVRREFWGFTWPRAVSRISQVAIQRLDIILIAVLRSPTEAAVYTAATRFVVLGQFGTLAIQQVLQPKFTALIARNENESLREVYRISAAWSMALVWPIYAIVGCAPLAYLGMFGDGYAGSDAVLVVWLMCVAMLFGVATGPADTLLMMSGRSRISLVNSLLALTLDVVLCLVLIPRMGISGAAVAWAVAVITRLTLAVWQNRGTLGGVGFGAAAGVVLAANVVCLIVPLLVIGLIVELDLPVLMLALLVCLPAYAGALFLARRILMLSVLRGLFGRRGENASPGGDPAAF